jgi:hypothetical protein
MAQNIASPDVREIPLSVFSGLVTNMDPVALPSGSSPDCSDVSFLPGGVSNRPCLQKVFATPMGTATVTYAKSYVDPAGVIRNLYLDSSGNLWVENVSATPGTYTLLTTTTPGSYARSITAFGREYIAVSDGLHGADIPLQVTALANGTLQLDRITQDGPGSPPAISSVALPAVAMVATGPPATLTVVEIDPGGIGGSGYYTQANIYVASGADQVEPGAIVTVTGTNATFDLTYTVVASYGTTLLVCSIPSPPTVFPPGTAYYLGGGTVTISSGVTMTRAGGIVTVKTAAAHQLQVGYQAQIAGISAATVGTSISSIVIANANLPGIATVTTSAPHGLVPGLLVSIQGVNAVVVGGNITSITRAGQVCTVVMASAHGLSPGAIITINSVPTSSFNTTGVVVSQVTSSTVFTFIQIDVDASDTSGTGNVSINWPIPQSATPTYFQVVSAPSATTFQVQVNYSDSPSSGWTSGTVKYAWSGTFFVATVPDAYTFTYQQGGPNATSSTVGSVTPYGQAAPGLHQLSVAFLTRQGYLTRPSPPVTVQANGGQYFSVSNIPIGPSNVVARILLFTAANGAYFFYIPAPPQVNGRIVGTATQVNDNTTTSIVLDFSDASLLAALGVSTNGNNIAAQTVIDGALGFGFYGSRLITFGQRNTVQSLLNLGFDGGYLPSAATLPTGWDATANVGGALATGHYGSGWTITVTGGAGDRGKLSQPFYQDYTGSPIATADTPYKIRVWLQPSAVLPGLTFYVAMTSASTSYSSVASIAGSLMSTGGSWLEAAFPSNTPGTIPSDFTFSVYAASSTTTVTLLVDELTLIFADSPYLTGLYGSYINNPEAFDGVSGAFGPENDTQQVMDVGIIRNSLYMLTRDPQGRLHETSQGNTEPAGWVVDQVAANCGMVSAFCLTKSQADDATASGGEEWFAWYSSTGIRIFGGQFPAKLSQEIQRPEGVTFPGAPDDLSALNQAAQKTAWALNDPAQKLMWFGIPSHSATAPDVIWTVNYVGMDTAAEISNGDPVHRAINGRISTSEFGRKWSPWTLPMNGAALLYRGSGALEPVFLGGNGSTPGAITGYGNVYTLNSAYYTDDDYGAVSPRYVTCALPDTDAASQLQLGNQMKMVSYSKSIIAGIGILNISIRFNALTKVWPLDCSRTLQTSPDFDLEWAGGQCQAQRFFIRFTVAPNPSGTSAHPSTDVSFALTGFALAVKKAGHLPVRGAV